LLLLISRHGINQLFDLLNAVMSIENNPESGFAFCNRWKFDGIELILRQCRIEILDHGGGVPSEVLERRGQPFNRGPSAGKRSHGLGLATVDPISKVFGWKVEFLTEGAKGRVILDLSSSQVE
jgi:signal transduction histidine kinase